MPTIAYENIPAGLLASMDQTETYIKGSTILSAGLIELMRYRVSCMNQCAYCIDMHFKDARAAGESDMRIYSVNVWRKTSFYTELEQSVLAWAEVMTSLAVDGDKKDQILQALMEHFSQQDIANITLAVAQINSWNRLASAFGFEVGSYRVGQFDS